MSKLTQNSTLPIAYDTPSVLPSEAEVSVRLSAHAEVRGVAYCPLPIAHCPLPIAYCPLPIAHCLFPDK